MAERTDHVYTYTVYVYACVGGYMCVYICVCMFYLCRILFL